MRAIRVRRVGVRMHCRELVQRFGVNRIMRAIDNAVQYRPPVKASRRLIGLMLDMEIDVAFERSLVSV